MLSRRSTEINHVSFTNVGEDVFYGGEQDVFISVEMGQYPFPFIIRQRVSAMLRCGE